MFDFLEKDKSISYYFVIVFFYLLPLLKFFDITSVIFVKIIIKKKPVPLFTGSMLCKCLYVSSDLLFFRRLKRSHHKYKSHKSRCNSTILFLYSKEKKTMRKEKGRDRLRMAYYIVKKKKNIYMNIDIPVLELVDGSNIHMSLEHCSYVNKNDFFIKGTNLDLFFTQNEIFPFISKHTPAKKKNPFLFRSTFLLKNV